MQTKQELFEMVTDLRKNIPSLFTMPITDEMAEQHGIRSCFVLTSGEFKDTTVIIKDIIIEDGGLLKIDYQAFDIDKKTVEDVTGLNVVVGNIINFFLAESALAQFGEDDE